MQMLEIRYGAEPTDRTTAKDSVEWYDDVAIKHAWLEILIA